MNLSTDCKILIDGYIDEVCINLPKKKRPDIAVEIRSLILDALEARSREFETDPDQEMVIATLKELGAPLEMASAYHAHNYIIGPQMYAPFIMTVRGVLLFMGLFYVLAFFLSWGEATHSLSAFLETIWGLLVSFFDNALQNFGVIFLIFIILERVLPEQDWVVQLKAWGAVSNIPFLRRVFGRTAVGEWGHQGSETLPKTKLVTRREIVFEMVIILLVMILLNFLPHKIGIFGFFNGDPWFAPLLAPAFSVYLPWWNIYWLLALTLNFVLLRQGRWVAATRWANLGLMIFSGLIVWAMLLGPPVLGLGLEYMDANQLNVEALRFTENALLPVLNTIIKIILIMHLIVKVPLVFYKTIKLIRVPKTGGVPEKRV